MGETELPKYLIAAGKKPLGERVNVYHKIKTLGGIIDALDEDERLSIAGTSLGRILSSSVFFNIIYEC